MAGKESFNDFTNLSMAFSSSSIFPSLAVFPRSRSSVYRAIRSSSLSLSSDRINVGSIKDFGASLIYIKSAR